MIDIHLGSTEILYVLVTIITFTTLKIPARLRDHILENRLVATFLLVSWGICCLANAVGIAVWIIQNLRT